MIDENSDQFHYSLEPLHGIQLNVFKHEGGGQSKWWAPTDQQKDVWWGGGVYKKLAPSDFFVVHSVWIWIDLMILREGTVNVISSDPPLI